MGTLGVVYVVVVILMAMVVVVMAATMVVVGVAGASSSNSGIGANVKLLWIEVSSCSLFFEFLFCIRADLRGQGCLGSGLSILAVLLLFCRC